MKIENVVSNFDMLEEIIGYKYQKIDKLVNALTHSSFINEKNKSLKSNERYEFLGDSILNIAVSEYIFTNRPNLSEGEMTKARASIVCEASLAKCANSISLGKYLLLGKGEELTGGRSRPSILADAFEAVICSIYLDGGMENAKKFIYDNLKQIINDVLKGASFIDYKTKLQETIQKKSDVKLVYEVLEEKGPDHNKFFTVQVKFGEKTLGIGDGRSKKEAEQNAARIALENKQLKEFTFENMPVKEND